MLASEAPFLCLGASLAHIFVSWISSAQLIIPSLSAGDATFVSYYNTMLWMKDSSCLPWGTTICETFFGLLGNTYLPFLDQYTVNFEPASAAVLSMRYTCKHTTYYMYPLSHTTEWAVLFNNTARPLAPLDALAGGGGGRCWTSEESGAPGVCGGELW